MRTAVSLGYRTDLMMLALQGSSIESGPAYTVIRTPANPTFWWGNFLLYPDPLAPAALSTWAADFRREFPTSEHLAVGIDTVDGVFDRDDECTALGLELERSTVMTAHAVTAPVRPNTDADNRRLETDAEWAAAIELQMLQNADETSADHRVFVERRMAAMRALSEAGHGGWFGAFLDGELRAGMGIFTDGSGVARFQNVDTHPDFRRRGLAGTLVHRCSTYAFDDLGADTLVMVADPDYVAIAVYRSVGFADTETQLQIQGH